MNLPPDRAELINMSDPISVGISDLQAACAAVVALSEGKYGLVGYETLTFCPIGSVVNTLDPAWKERFGVGLLDGIKAVSKERFAAALESFRLERKERSSLNDIVGNAHKWAASIRKAQESPHA